MYNTLSSVIRFTIQLKTLTSKKNQTAEFDMKSGHSDTSNLASNPPIFAEHLAGSAASFPASTYPPESSSSSTEPSVKSRLFTFHRDNLMRQPLSLEYLRSEWHRWQQHSNGSSISSAREVAAPPALSIISEVALDPHSWSLWHQSWKINTGGQWLLKSAAFVYMRQTAEPLALLCLGLRVKFPR